MSGSENVVARVIGLAGSWRGEQLEYELHGLGVDVRRVAGVLPVDRFDGRPAQAWVNQAVAMWTVRRRLTPGEIGCALAHLRAQRDAAAAREEWSWILEDDARLTVSPDGFRALVEWVTGSGSARPTVVLLCHLAAIVDPRPVAAVGGLVVHRAVVPPDLAACYLLNRAAARALADCTLPVIGPADWPPRSAGSIEFLVVSPQLAAVDGNAVSAIGPRPGDAWPEGTRSIRAFVTICYLAWPFLRRHLPAPAYRNMFLRFPILRRLAARRGQRHPAGISMLPTRWSGVLRSGGGRT